MKKYTLILVLPLLFCGFSSCSDDDEPRNEVHASDIILRCGESRSLNINIYGKMKISDGFIASYNDNVITGLHVGVTTGEIKNGSPVKITVKSNISKIAEISRDWGKSKYDVLEESSKIGKFSLSSDTEDIWGCFSSDKKVLYMYQFTNDKLSGSSLVVHKSLTETLANYLKERFTMIKSSYLIGDYYIGVSGMDADDDNIERATTVVTVSAYNTNYYMVQFYQYK